MNVLCRHAHTFCHKLDALEDALLARLPRPRANLLALGWLALLLGVLFCVHEPWRDELQSWLMARDMSFMELLRNAGNEGHPIGWHLFLKPFVLAGVPFTVVRLANIGIVLAAAACLLYRAPFRLWHCLLFVSSPPFLEFGTCTRCYGLLLLLLCLFCVVWKERDTRPLACALCLGGMVNMVALCLPFAAGLGALWLWEARPRLLRQPRTACALLLLLALGLFGAAQLIPPPDKLRVMFDARLAVIDTGLLRPRNLLLLLTLPPAALLIAVLGRVSRAYAAILTGTALFFLWVHIGAWGLSLRHLYLFITLIFALIWLARDEAERTDQTGRQEPIRAANRTLLRTALALTALSLAQSGVIIAKEAICLGTNTQLAAPFVRAHLQGRAIAAHHLTRVCPLAALVPGLRFWNPAALRWDTHAIFDAHYLLWGKMPVELAARRVFAHCPEPRPALIFSERWRHPERDGYALVFVSDRLNRHGEDIFIYLPRETLTPDTPALPPHSTLVPPDKQKPAPVSRWRMPLSNGTFPRGGKP